jgi:hypothetical protein
MFHVKHGSNGLKGLRESLASTFVPLGAFKMFHVKHFERGGSEIPTGVRHGLASKEAGELINRECFT